MKIAWETVKTFIKDGVDGLWKMVTDKMDLICEMIVSQIIEWVQTKIISKAFTKLAVLFIPFAGLIAAVKTLWDTIKFIKEKIDTVKLAESMLDVIGPAAKGDAGPAAGKVHQTLAKAMPLAIGLLAKLVGLGGVSAQIKKDSHEAQAPVNKVIDWVIDKILAGIDWLKAQAKSLFGGKDDEVTEAKKQISATDEAAKTSGNPASADFNLKTSDEAIGNIPPANASSSAQNANENPANQAPPALPKTNTAAELIDAFTDRKGMEVAELYPTLGAEMDNVELAAQEKRQASLPLLSASQNSSGKEQQPQKAVIKLGKATIDSSVQGSTNGKPQFPTLPTDGETLVKGAGDRPTIKLGGKNDPTRLARMTKQGSDELRTASSQVTQEINKATFDSLRFLLMKMQPFSLEKLWMPQALLSFPN